MLIQSVLNECNTRYMKHQQTKLPGIKCPTCSASANCTDDCEQCLKKIHFEQFDRKYDCINMADFYTCKYAYRYTSEIIYALERLIDLQDQGTLKVLSLGCGPCTDLFAIDYLKNKGNLRFQSLDYMGIDYSQDVWQNIHADLKNYSPENFSINFFYEDTCSFLNTLSTSDWIPNLIIFQYVFSDMQKHTGSENTAQFVKQFSTYYNNKSLPKSYIILNDINHYMSRDYFDILAKNISPSTIIHRGRFCDDNATSSFYPRGYTYGDNSDGEFPANKNFFNVSPLHPYRPYDTCASAQMLIKKE